MDKPSKRPIRTLAAAGAAVLLVGAFVWIKNRGDDAPEPTKKAPIVSQTPAPEEAKAPVPAAVTPSADAAAAPVAPVPVPPAPVAATPVPAPTPPAPPVPVVVPAPPAPGAMAEGGTVAPATAVMSEGTITSIPGIPAVPQTGDVPTVPMGQSQESPGVKTMAETPALSDLPPGPPPVMLPGSAVTKSTGEEIPRMITPTESSVTATPPPASTDPKVAMAKTDPSKVGPDNATAAKKPPVDVTGAPASTRDMEGKESEEFPGDLPKSKDKETEKPKESVKSTAKRSTNTDMAGWELLQYQGADYVTAPSINRFYGFEKLSIDGKNIVFRSKVLMIRAALGSQEILINNIKFMLSDPVVELNGKPCFSRLDLCKLIDPILRPAFISTAGNFDTVILDPGHGGHDSGAKGVYGYEKDFALKLAFKVRDALKKQGFKVIMTRETDIFLSLGARVAVANKIPNSIYISLHFNSGGPSASGIETFALSPQGSASVYGPRDTDYVAFQGNQRDSENIALATAVHASVIHQFRLVDRGVKRARWHVLKGLQRPGILFEGGFVTNSGDGVLIAADNFRTKLADVITQAVLNYRRAVQPKRPTR